MTQLINITTDDNQLTRGTFVENVKFMIDGDIIIEYENVKLPITIESYYGSYLISTREKLNDKHIGEPFLLMFNIIPSGPIELSFLNRTNTYTSNELMPMLLRFLKCMGFTVITLQDASKKMINDTYFFMSHLTLLQKGAYFYEKYGFTPLPIRSGTYYYFNGHIYKPSIRRLYSIVDEMAPITYQCFINKIKKFFGKISSDKIILSERKRTNRTNTDETKKHATDIINSCERLPTINGSKNIREMLVLWSEVKNRTKETTTNIYYFFNVFRLIHELLKELPHISNTEGDRIYDWHCEVIVEYIKSIQKSQNMIHYIK